MQTKAKVETEGGGEVHFLRPYSDIPEPTLPLAKEGRRTYDEWCRNLLHAGLLTVKTREHVESFAVSVDALKKAIETGKNIRAAMEMRRTAQLKLEKLDADKTIVTSGGGESVYAQFGFAKRAKEARLRKK